MSSELRLYLMLRRRDATWAISVHRDLSSAVGGWSARDENIFSGILHVGFDRPACQAFDDLALSYEGRMLLTGSARFALPSAFKATAFAVAEVAGLPIYLAIGGWGYDVDPTEMSPPYETNGSVTSGIAGEPE